MTKLNPILLFSILLCSANAAATSMEPLCKLQNATVEVTPELECLTLSLGESMFACDGGDGPILIFENNCSADVVLTHDQDCEAVECWAQEYRTPAGERTVVAIPASTFDYSEEGINDSWSLALSMDDEIYGLELSYTVTRAGVPDSEYGGCQQFGAGNSLSLLLCLFGVLWFERRFRAARKVVLS